MAKNGMAHVTQCLKKLVDTQTSDRDLLRRFLEHEDEGAFETLVRRHDRLVRSAIGKVMGSSAEAEDAYQATFLVLVRRARAIDWRPGLGSWLYGVAHQVAVKAQARNTKRVRLKGAAKQQSILPPDLSWQEACDLLHAELDRLPDQYRMPLLLCYLEGKTREEAAAALGVTSGTVKGRIRRGCDMLRDRLARRGVALSVGLLAMLAAPTRTPAAIASPSAVVAAVRGAAQASVTELAREVVMGVVFAKLAKALAIGVLAIGLIAALVAAGGLAAQTKPPETPPPAAQTKSETPATPGDQPAAEPAKEGNEDAIVIKGGVFGPDGKPVAGAKVRFLDAVAEADKDGAYRVAFARPAGDRGAFTKTARYWYVVAATAEGFGPDIRPIGTADRDGHLDLHLVKDDVPIEGRILDLEGRPVAGATVRVARLNAVADENLDLFLKAWKKGPEEAMGIAPALPVMMGPKGGAAKESARPQWRKLSSPEQWGFLNPVTTDKDGKFRLTGVGRERFVELAISGETIQSAQVKVVTRQGIDVKDLSKPDPEYFKQNGPFVKPIFLPFPPLYGSTFEHLVGPTKPLVGVVRDKATGKPLAGVRILGRVGSRNINEIRDIETVSDEKGQYKLTGLAKAERYPIGAVAKERTAYLPQARELNDTEGLKPLQADFDLVRGVTVQGRLIDQATGKPASGTVSYALLPANPHFVDEGRVGGPVGEAVLQRQTVGERGDFQLTVFPGAGVLSAQADDGRYLPIVVAPEDQKKGVSVGGLGVNGATFVHGHAYRVIDAAEGVEPLKIDLELLTGRTLTGTVVGPDGQPLAGAVGILAPEITFGFRSASPTLRLEKDSAKFTVDNMDPRQPPLLIFRHPEKNLAGQLEVRGGEKEPLTARLQPGGKLTGRLLDAAGQPLADARIDLRLSPKAGPAPQRHAFLARVKTDMEGRFTMEAILPETELLLLVGVADKDNELGRTIHSVNDLTWKAGEAKDLGDVKTQHKMKPAGNE
jgi:RNA polymerase sigma factor (sigma-70 family)